MTIKCHGTSEDPLPKPYELSSSNFFLSYERFTKHIGDGRT